MTNVEKAIAYFSSMGLESYMERDDESRLFLKVQTLDDFLMVELSPDEINYRAELFDESSD